MWLKLFALFEYVYKKEKLHFSSELIWANVIILAKDIDGSFFFLLEKQTLDLVNSKCLCEKFGFCIRMCNFLKTYARNFVKFQLYLTKIYWTNRWIWSIDTSSVKSKKISWIEIIFQQKSMYSNFTFGLI